MSEPTTLYLLENVDRQRQRSAPLTCSRQETSRPGSRLAMPGRSRGRRGGASVIGAMSLADGGATVVIVVVVDVVVASGTSGSASGGLS